MKWTPTHKENPLLKKSERKTIEAAVEKYHQAQKEGLSQFYKLQQAKKLAKNIKWEVVEHLDKLLIQFEKKFLENGGKVIWAENETEAQKAILSICQDHKAASVVTSKSTVLEEINLHRFLSNHKINSNTTDIGAFIQQLDKQPPFQMVSATLSKTKEEIAELFSDKIDTRETFSASHLARAAKFKVQEKIEQADIGITGANFLLAEEGAVCISGNEGNIRSLTTSPDVHIVVTGIDKILPKLSDLNLFWPLLAAHGTGQIVTTYNSIFTGSRSQKENQGPNGMYVILLDNGRVNLMKKEVRESLYCIRCGACQNADAVFKTIGNKPYKSVYAGPIGNVINPHLKTMKEYGHLSFLSPLDGTARKSCPLDIELDRMQLENRRQFIRAGHGTLVDKGHWQSYKQIVSNRAMMNAGWGKAKQFMYQNIFGKAWGVKKQAIQFSPKSFHQLWLQQEKEQRREEER